MKYQTLSAKRYPALLLPLLLSGMICGCGKGTPTETPPEKPQSASEQTSENTEASSELPGPVVRDHSDPQFLKVLLPDENNPALSFLPPDLFEGYQAAEIRPLGDRVLLIDERAMGWESDPGEEGESGFAADENPVTDTAGDDFPDEASTETYGEYDDYGFSEGESFGFEYHFALYNPWDNTIDEKLDLDLGAYDAFQTIGNRLVLSNYSTCQAAVYDENLQLIGEYDISEISEISSFSLISSENGGFAYTYASDMQGMLEINAEDLSWKILPLDLYSSTPEAISPDGQHLVISGVEKDTLRRQPMIYDTISGESILADGSGHYDFSVSNRGFLSSENLFDSFWCYQPYDGTATWYYIPDSGRAQLLGEERIVIDYSDTDYDSGEEYTTFIMHDLEGKALSSFKLYNGNIQEPDGHLQVTSRYFQLPDCDRIFFLCYRTDADYNALTPQLMVWDPTCPASEEIGDLESCESKASLQQAHADEIDTYFDRTLIDDPDSYDWGNLQDCRERIDALEEKYGIHIYFGPEVPDVISEYSVSQELDPDTIEGTLDAFETQLSLYPDNFFHQLAFGDNYDLCVYLTGHLTSNSDYVDFDPAAYVTELDGSIIMVLDSLYSWDFNYTFNHELSHMIDRRLSYLSIFRTDCLFSETTWASYNPENYDYLYDYVDYEGKADYDTYSDWFVDAYGMTYPTEDRAEIFGRSMESYLADYDTYDIFQEDSIILEKLGYYAQCIRDGFDTSGWDEVLPWEKYLRTSGE